MDNREHRDTLFGKVTLRFRTRSDETEYQQSIAESRLKIARIALGAAIILNAIYTLWDRLAFSSALASVTFIREVVMTIFLATLFGLLFIPRLRAGANLILAGGVLAYTIFFASINTLEQTPYIFVANGTLIVLWPYLFLTGNPLLAMASGGVSSLAFAVILSAQRTFDAEYVILCLLLFATNFSGVIFAYQLELFRRREFTATRALSRERTRFRDLLVSVLPEPIADRLHRGDRVADLHPRVVVLFADIVGFTPLALGTSPALLCIGSTRCSMSSMR